MRFMIMHKMTKELEKGLPPDAATLEGVGKLMGDAMAKRIFLGGEGLKPSSQRVHITYRGGKRTVLDGPFAESKELVAGFALMKVRSREEALHWCDRFAGVVGDVELHLGPVVETWDLGMGPKPENAPMRFLSVTVGGPDGDRDVAPNPALQETMGALIAEMTKAGVLEATGGLASTKHGARLRFDRGRRTVIDGPFAESKELIAGYAIFELPSKDAAIEWGTRFGDVVKVDEVEVRLMCD